MTHVTDWAKQNNMTVNLKAVEVVFRRPNAAHELLPNAMSDHLMSKHLSEQNSSELFFRHDFNFCNHIDTVVSICNQRLYLLAQRRKAK